MSVCTIIISPVAVTEPISIRAYPHGLEKVVAIAIDYTHLSTVVNNYITMRKFHLIWCLCNLMHNLHNHSMEERSHSPTVSNVNATTPSWTMSLQMHACSFKPLCSDTQVVHFLLPSVHLQCMEGGSSMKVLTSN